MVSQPFFAPHACSPCRYVVLLCYMSLLLFPRLSWGKNFLFLLRASCVVILFPLCLLPSVPLTILRRNDNADIPCSCFPTTSPSFWSMSLAAARHKDCRDSSLLADSKCAQFNFWSSLGTFCGDIIVPTRCASQPHCAQKRT